MLCEAIRGHLQSLIETLLVIFLYISGECERFITYIVIIYIFVYCDNMSNNVCVVGDVLIRCSFLQFDSYSS